MHESGLARAIVETLRRRHGWSRARVLLSDPSFSHSGEALRLHLEAEGGDLDLDHVEVVVVPVPAVCLGCGGPASMSEPTEVCEACGRAALVPASRSPSVEVELTFDGGMGAIAT